VALDPAKGVIYMPASSDTKPAGCIDCHVGSAGVLTYFTVF
jgi:hypothetical protein